VSLWQACGAILPILYILFCILVWGLSFAVTRSAVQQIPPLTLASLRFFLAAALLWPLTRKVTIRLKPEDRKLIWALTLSGISFYFAFENIGLKLTTASHASLIIATIPLGTELVSAWRSRQWPKATTWLGALLALSGVGLLVGKSDGTASLAGDIMMFGAVACWITYTFLVQHVSGRYANLLVTRWIMLLGAVTLLPGAVVETFLYGIPRPTASAWIQVVFLGIVCSALAYDFYNRAVPALGPAAANSSIYFIPLVGVVGGIVLLGEPVTPALFWAGALIFCGVLAARLRQGDKRANT
jgi:drug/metabolite transporter (DMT)-like permease